MRFSWISTIISVYFLSILLYSFMDDTDFWAHFFWIDTLAICIFGWLFNFVKRKSQIELDLILFVTFMKAFGLMYYIVGISLDKEKWMRTNIYFYITAVISAFIGMVFHVNKTWKRKAL